MIATSTKPVRQCRGCALNLVAKCAVFEHPVLKWKHRHCEGYNNEALIKQYQRAQQIEGAKKRRKKRAEKAKLAHTEPHYDGFRRPGRSR